MTALERRLALGDALRAALTSAWWWASAGHGAGRDQVGAAAALLLASAAPALAARALPHRYLSLRTAVVLASWVAIAAAAASLPAADLPRAALGVLPAPLSHAARFLATTRALPLLLSGLAFPVPSLPALAAAQLAGIAAAGRGARRAAACALSGVASPAARRVQAAAAAVLCAASRVVVAAVGLGEDASLRLPPERELEAPWVCAALALWCQAVLGVLLPLAVAAMTERRRRQKQRRRRQKQRRPRWCMGQRGPAEGQGRPWLDAQATLMAAAVGCSWCLSLWHGIAVLAAPLSIDDFAPQQMT
eukprot:scaffold14.g1036.t1